MASAPTMKAALYTTYGAPADVLKIVDFPKPTPGKKVRRAGVTYHPSPLTGFIGTPLPT